MANFYLDNEDLRFYLEGGLDWGALVELTEEGYRAPDGFTAAPEAVEFYRQTLELVGQFVSDQVAPKVKQLDHAEPRLVNGEVFHPPFFDELMTQLTGLGIHGLSLPRELGGTNAPMLVGMFVSELLARGDVSLMTHNSFHGGMAVAMLMYSIKEGTTSFDKSRHQISKTRFGEAISEIIRGEAWGSMDITEPDAGSDMAALRVRGEQGADGRWTLSGQKIFLTSGHGKYHFVIARTEDPAVEPGLEGLSLFLAPAYEGGPGARRRLATIDRLEEKIGHHSSATCSVSFDGTPAELIGKRGEGFKQMLLLMNAARLSVGFEAIGLAEAASRLAKAYAAERRSMGKTIDHHEVIADYLDEMSTDIAALRALAVYGGYHEEMAQRLDRALILSVDPGSGEAERMRRDQRRHARRARRVTPLLKYLAAEKAVEIARRGIQIHGGVGYTQDYGAEKLLRDALVLPIYEGTSQIQALMAMKDGLGRILKNPQAFLSKAAQARWRAISSRDPIERRVARLQSLLHSTEQHLVSRTATDKLRAVRTHPLSEWPRALRANWDPKRDFAHAMLHAERFTRLTADVVIAEVLLEQVGRQASRRPLLERWLERAEPRDHFLHHEITTTGDRLLEELAKIPLDASVH